MKRNTLLSVWMQAGLLFVGLEFSYSLSAQTENDLERIKKTVPKKSNRDSVRVIAKQPNGSDSLLVTAKLAPKDTNRKGSIRHYLFGADEKWPRPAVAVRASLILPGAGQFYNKSYWKIPLVWAGIGTCVYFAIDNNNQYLYYQQAYIDNPQNAGLRVFRDSYRRNRDFSIILGALAYTLTAIEAYTDAHLKHFDVSDDLSLHLYPIKTTFPTVGGQGRMTVGPGVALKF